MYFGPPVGALDYFAALNHRPVAPGEGAALLPPTPPEFLLDTVSMLKVVGHAAPLLLQCCFAQSIVLCLYVCRTSCMSCLGTSRAAATGSC